MDGISAKYFNSSGLKNWNDIAYRKKLLVVGSSQPNNIPEYMWQMIQFTWSVDIGFYWHIYENVV